MKTRRESGEVALQPFEVLALTQTDRDESCCALLAAALDVKF
jgi:hypothetical protein